MAADESEYGGRSGIIQKEADGHVDLTGKERRYIHAVFRRRTAGVDETIPSDDLHRPFVDEVIADTPTRTNGRLPNEFEGERLV